MLDLPADAPLEEVVARLAELHAAYRADYAAYYERHADPGLPRRCAAPTRRSCWCPASACSPSARTSRPPGSRASSTSTRSTSCAAPRRVSTYAPIDEAEKFRIEYWSLEEAKLQRMPKPKPLATRIALVTGGGSGIGRAIAPGWPPRAPASSSPTSTLRAAEAVAAELGAADVAVGVAVDVTDDATQVDAAVARPLLGLRRRRPGRQQRRPVDLQAAAGDHRAPTGTSSTTSWPRAPSSSPATRPGS